MSKLYHKGNKKGFPFYCCSAVLVNVQQLPTTAPDQTPPKSLVSGAPNGARNLRRWSWSPWPSPEGAPSSAAACPCPTEPGEDGENRSKKCDMYIMTCLWHVWCFWHVLKCRFLALALLSYPKIVVPFWWWTIHPSNAEALICLIRPDGTPCGALWSVSKCGRS